jgi:hypothetical protein
MVLDTYTGYNINELNNELDKFNKELNKKEIKYRNISDKFNNLCLKNIIKLKTILNKKCSKDFNFEIKLEFDTITLYYYNTNFAQFNFSYNYIYGDERKKENDINFVINYIKYDFDVDDNHKLNAIILLGNIGEDIKNKSIFYKNLLKFYKVYYTTQKEKYQLESEVSKIKNKIKSVHKSIEFEILDKSIYVGVTYIRDILLTAKKTLHKRNKIHKFTIKKIINDSIYIEYYMYNNIPEGSHMRISKEDLISLIYDEKFKLESIKDERLIKIKNLIE